MLLSRFSCYNRRMKGIATETIKKYLPSLSVFRRNIKLKNLPLVYKSLYDFEEMGIQDQRFLLINVKDKNLGPKDFKKHEKVFRELIDYPQVWFLKELHFNKVQRMIENEFNFIVEDKQVHLPAVSVSIKPVNDRITKNMDVIGLSVTMLIREILVGDLSGKNKVEIAEIFKTTKMSTGRAIEPLIANGLCEENKIGVAKLIRFKQRHELWEFVRKNIKSPIKKTVFTDALPMGLPFSGVSALSKRSMLSEDEISFFAVDAKNFKEKFNKFKIVLEEFAKSKIEIWDRAPALVEDNCINIIDIYLINKENADERIQIELDNLLKNNNLQIGKYD